MELPREFFGRDPLTCSRELIGCELFAGECSGIIVETEAYSAVGDEACHTFFRPSTRRFMECHDAGAAYVYLNYGMYWLFNVLIKGRGGAQDGFVLIRAVEPVRGIELMRQRRGRHALRELCSGPGKLSQAFGICGADHGIDLCGEKIGFRRALEKPQVETCVRIGISKAAHLPWRYLLKGSLFVSVAAGGKKPRGKRSYTDSKK